MTRRELLKILGLGTIALALPFPIFNTKNEPWADPDMHVIKLSPGYWDVHQTMHIQGQPRPTSKVVTYLSDGNTVVKYDKFARRVK